MRYALIMLLLCYSLTLRATTYYVATTGSDSNSGSSSSPWKTLAYAGSKAKASGDIIHVNAGTYTETSQCVLAPGVSIEGVGVTSIIKSHYTSSGSGDGLINLSSSSQNTPGNQSISYLKLDGDNLTGNGAIYVHYRGNVLVHHCTIVDFSSTGIIVEGENSWNSQPVTFSSGNQIYNNTITNCHGGSGGGNIRITGQTACLIHDNIVDGRARSMQNSVTLSNNKATTIYNNTFYTLNNRGSAFNFVFEIWDTWGGLEIRNNTFNGGGTIDVGGHYTYKGSYPFGVSIHNNDMILPALEVYNASEVIAITVESWTTLNDVYIYSNHIKNFGTGVQVTFGMNSGGTASNFYIYNNLFDNIGYSNTQGGSSAIGFVYQAGVSVASWKNINIMNNVIKGGGSSSNMGIRYHMTGATTNLSIKNNIITGFGTRAVNFVNEGGSLSNVQIANNIFYNNGETVNLGGISPSSYTNSPNYTSDPLFVSATDFHIQSGSPAIGKGAVISGVTTDYAGNSYKNPPSIGAYESGSAAPVTPVSPVYQSAVTENATPSVLKVTYDLNLANIVPAASAFKVLVNSVARAVNSVALSGTNVQLTLATPVAYGETVTIYYTKPSVNPIQTSSGGQAGSIIAQAVTNNVNAVIPAYLSSSVENATPTLLEMTYTMSLAGIVPAVSSFSVLVNSVARTVNKVAVTGTKTQLTLSGPVLYGDIVTVTYIKPSVNPLQASTGGLAVNITAQAVTNRVIAVNPVYVSSSVEKATPAILEMTYNMSLANIVPAVSSFSVLVNSTVRTLSTVTISGTKVKLTLLYQVVPGDIVNVSYTKPATNFLQSTSGGIASGISKLPVTNNCLNIAPTAVLTSPAANSTFTSQSNISITASASDADGSVNLVEFYTGSTKLGSASAAPYSFNWNNVPAGTYSLTVTATDNQNTKTVSPSVSISVLDRITTPNKHPIIHIYNPRKGTSYDNLSTVTIDAVASDPDGTISKVEFYNGSEKLVELSSDPYTYTWKDVASGTYNITAIATDNLNDTTISAPIEFVVGSSFKYDANSDNIKLYPNPNNGHFSIEFVNPLQNEKSEIVITDISGKQVYHGPVLKEELLKQIDLPDGRSGIYVMMIKDKDILVTKKFIKN